MKVAEMCSSPLADEATYSSASFSKTNETSTESSQNKSLPPISTLLNPISQHPDKTSTHHENHKPYLQTKPNSVLESQKSSDSNSPSLLNLPPETPTKSQSSTQTHPSPPLTTPSLSRSNSSILLNEQGSLNTLTPESRHSPPESVASLSKSSPSLDPHEITVSKQQYPRSPSQSSHSENSFNSHSNTLTPTYQQSQWHSQHSQMLPSNQQDAVVAVSPKDTKQDSAIQQQQQVMQYNAAIAASGLPSEYHYYRASFEKDVYQSVTRGNERTMADLRKVIDHCALIGQFATQYGEICSRTSNSRPDIWPMQQTIPIPTEAHVSEMINKAFDVLYVLNALKDEASRRGPSEIELIRNKRSTTGASSRPKYRKRTKRPAPPGRCHSCNIQETPEWRRGPDGARTLCNACGLHFAKLTRKRAQNAIQEQQQRMAQHRAFLHPYPPPYLQMANPNQNTLNIAHYPGFPQHNVGQGGNQFINTTPPSVSRVAQVGYSTATRIEID